MKKKMKGISKNSDLLRANPDFKGLSEGKRDKTLIIRGLLKIEYEESSGNVFADLGLGNAKELQTRALIGYHLVQLLKDKNMKQRDVAAVLGIKQAEVSHLLNGHFSRFTTDKLLEFLKRMDQKVTIQISPHKQGEPFHQVAFGA